MGDIVHNVGSSTSAIRPANKPVITVADNTTLENGSTFVAPVADAKNWNGKNISYTIDDSAVDMSNDGTYVITYTAIDTLGRTTVENRNIIVEAPVEPAHYSFVAQVANQVFVKFKLYQEFYDVNPTLEPGASVLALPASQGGTTPKEWGMVGYILAYTHSTDSAERKVSHLLQFSNDQPGVSAELQTPGTESSSVWTSSSNFVDGGSPVTFVPEGPA